MIERSRGIPSYFSCVHLSPPVQFIGVFHPVCMVVGLKVKFA
jgi:hypothetical protein